MISEDEKEKVREATDIVELVSETVQLTPRGADLWGCCPFHHEKSPSFHVIPSRGLWKCFGCGRGGDVFAFVMERDHCGFSDAVRTLAERAGIQLSESAWRATSGSSTKKNRLYDAMDAAALFYHRQLTTVRSTEADAARAYLAGRGFGLKVADRWDLGFAPGRGALVRELSRQGYTRQELIDARLATQRDDGSLRDTFYGRVMFPIRDERGKVVALGGRVLDDRKPKYVNSADSPIYSKSHTVFALDRAKSHITAQMEVIIEEGYTDVISTHEAGIQNAVAPLGTALTAQHVKMLTRYLTASGDRVARGRIVCLFDGDNAGLGAAERALSFVPLTSAQMYCVVLPDGKDPAEFLASDGADAMRSLLDNPEPLARFVIDRHLTRFDLETPEGRANALADVAQAMAPIKGTALSDEYEQYVSGRLMVGIDTVKSAMARVRWEPPVGSQDNDDYLPRSSASFESQLWSSGGSLAGSGQSAGAASASADAPGTGSRNAQALTPEDASMVQAERETLSMIAEDVDAAQPYVEKLAEVEWADPRDQAIAWALLALPPGTSSLEALDAAQAVVPNADSLLADGTRYSSQENPENDRTLGFLVDDLVARSLRRRIDRGRARLRATSPAEDPQGYDELFKEVSDLQKRLLAMETNRRTTM